MTFKYDFPGILSIDNGLSFDISDWTPILIKNLFMTPAFSLSDVNAFPFLSFNKPILAFVFYFPLILFTNFQKSFGS